MTHKGTRNAIFSLRTLMERAIEVQKDVYICFIDCSKTFDEVKHSNLFDILLRHTCNGKDLRVIRNLYWAQEATIRIDYDCSVYKPIRREVRQSCLLFFSRPLQYLQRNNSTECVRVGGNNIKNLRYADDAVLIADSEEKLQNILKTVT